MALPKSSEGGGDAVASNKQRGVGIFTTDHAWRALWSGNLEKDTLEATTIRGLHCYDRT